MSNNKKHTEGQTPEVNDTEHKANEKGTIVHHKRNRRKKRNIFGKIGRFIGNEWNAYWHTPTTRAQRYRRAAIILGVAGIAGTVGYGIGYGKGSNSMPKGDDEYDDDRTDRYVTDDEPIVTEFMSDTEDDSEF